MDHYVYSTNLKRHSRLKLPPSSHRKAGQSVVVRKEATCAERQPGDQPHMATDQPKGTSRGEINIVVVR